MNWNSKLYDQHHGFVSKYGEDLVDVLAPQAGERILDIGCGTGDLAALITRHRATVVGIDNSPEMIDTAKKKYPSIQFELKSASDFHYDHPFDAIFSNAALHWVIKYEEAIRCIHRALKPSGRFVAEFGGKGNVANIINALKFQLIKFGYRETANKQVWYFPSLSEYSSLLERNGFRVIFAAHFDRLTLLESANGIRSWLQMFASLFLENIAKEIVDEIVNEVESELKSTNYNNGHWYADYVRLKIVAIRN